MLGGLVDQSGYPKFHRKFVDIAYREYYIIHGVHIFDMST